MMIRCDVVVIGAGPGGLAAAKGALDAGARRVVVLERDSRPGGILNQCIHDGFGLIRYGQTLTGPEYAVRALREAQDAGAEIRTGHQVVGIERLYEGEDKCSDRDPGSTIKVTAVSPDGLKTFAAGAAVLALGCRERTRGQISIPGSRPAGVFTAGVVQNFVNVRNVMPGRRVVILGSGDVGMIMARRLTLEGASVEAVLEVLPQPAGLARNVSQCLYDYGIPLLCSHTVSRIIGKRKLEAVEIARIDENRKPIPETKRIIACDALVLSVGLIPENEIAAAAGIELDAKTNGTLTDPYLQTSAPGIFSCGNSRRIMDLADFVSEQGEMAGRNAWIYAGTVGADRADRKNEENESGMQAWDEARSTSMKKGYPVPGTVTCTLCPNGCQVKAERIEDDRVRYRYTGNRCPRGAAFAGQEMTAPRRMLTTTVRGPGGDLIPVRTEKPVAKEILADAVRELRTFTAPDHAVRCGDVLTYITDACGVKVPIQAAADVGQLDDKPE